MTRPLDAGPINLGPFAAGSVLIPALTTLLLGLSGISPDSLWVDQRLPTLWAAWNVKLACYAVPASLGVLLGLLAMFRTDFRLSAEIPSRVVGAIGIVLSTLLFVLPALRLHELYHVYVR